MDRGTKIKINEEKCNGCGACAFACHEGAIGMINGKAKFSQWSVRIKLIPLEVVTISTSGKIVN